MPPAPRSTAYRGLQEECRGVWYGRAVPFAAARCDFWPPAGDTTRPAQGSTCAHGAEVFFFFLAWFALSHRRAFRRQTLPPATAGAGPALRVVSCRVPSLPRSRQSLSISGRGSASDLDDGDPARGVVFAAHGLVPGRPPTVSPSLGPTGGQVHRLMIGAGQTQRVSSVGSCSYAVYRPCTPARAGRFGRSALVAWFHVKLAS